MELIELTSLEKKRLRNKLWMQNNPEKRKAYMKKYNETYKHPDPERYKIERAEYRKEYYKLNKEKEDADNRERAKILRKQKQAYIKVLKEESGCVDCKNKFPSYVLHFDHLPGFKKEFVIGRGISMNLSLDTLKEEIAKCEIVCGNCHAIRTYNRKQEKNNEFDSDCTE